MYLNGLVQNPSMCRDLIFELPVYVYTIWVKVYGAILRVDV